VAVLWSRIRAGLDLGHVAAHRVERLRSQIGELLEKPRVEIPGEAQHVVQHENLSVAARSGADANRGDRQLACDALGDRLRDQLEQNAEGAGFLGGLGVA